MKTFKVVFIKVPKLDIGPKIAELAEQLIITDADKIEIKPPDGYAIMTICEILEPVTIKKNEKKIFNN